MKLYTEISLANFEGWSGAEDTLNRVINAGKVDDLEAILEDMYPEGMDETDLNDLLRFEEDSIYEWLGMRSETAIQSDLDDAEEELAEYESDLEDIMAEYRENCEGLTDEEKEQLYADDYADDVAELEENIESAKQTIADLKEELEDF